MNASPPHVGNGVTASTSMGSSTESSTSTTPRPARPMTTRATTNATDPVDKLEQDFAKVMNALIAEKGVDGYRQFADHLLLLALQSSNRNRNTSQPQPNNSQITTLASEPTGVQPIMAEARHEHQPPQSQPQAQTEEPSQGGAIEGALALQSASPQPNSNSTTTPILPPLNDVELCGETAADMSTTPQALSLSLAQPNDRDYLGEKSEYGRSHFLELFVATPEDCAKKVKGRIHKPIVEQVGLKCVCCGTDYYAKGMEHMKTAADTLLRRHTMKCSSIPDELKAEFQKLKQNGPKNTGMTVPNYWIHCLVESGVYEEEGRLLYNPSSEENP